ncbi:MAG: aminotransferase class I/II-fold pyridoxal phosphate-dependent enzyme [Streptosporangiales bacterium]|nr:aminotransferase class I/II-fold pyridoxal phosphate-dependent enzyme [Streptosporangiales bacterium]
MTARSAEGIARDVARLVSDGGLAVGTQLPTVRELGRVLGVSPTTVSAAWRQLQRHGVIETGGRRGSTVRGMPGPAAPARFSRLHQDTAGKALDLSAGIPDPALLPDLRPALRKMGRQPETSSYFEHPVLPELEELLRADWPFEPELMTVVDGALDAMDRVFGATLRIGHRVLVENPTFPPILDLLEQQGVEVVGLPVDDSGVSVAALTEALAAGPAAALVVQPRAHNPHGHAMTAERAGELAGVLSDTGTLVIEDDHAGALSTSPLVSLGSWLPDRTVHIRGYSKSHGPDLRLAALGGAAVVVDQVVRRRLLGPAWSSRLLQLVLCHLLADPAATDAVRRAREAYAHRRRGLTEALAAQGVRVSGCDGINMWVDVHDEKSALVRLAVDQITAAPGSPFLAAPLPAGHIRLTCATIADGYEELATRIAPATRQHPTQYGAL